MLKMSSFTEQVGLQILSLESFKNDDFGTSEYFSGKKKRRILMSKTLWSGVVNFYHMQMSLVMSMQFISVMIEMTFLLFGNDEISLKLRPLIFVYLYTCTQFNQFRNKSSNKIQKVNILKNTRPSIE